MQLALCAFWSRTTPKDAGLPRASRNSRGQSLGGGRSSTIVCSFLWARRGGMRGDSALRKRSSEMCETCNPMCGQCKAAKLKAVVCPLCGRATLFTREACLHFLGRPHRVSDYERTQLASGGMGKAICCRCGADLLPVLEKEIVPLECRYSGIMCGYPCGRRTRSRMEGDMPCATQVPHGRCHCSSRKTLV